MSLQPYSIPKDGFAGTGTGATYSVQQTLAGANSATAEYPLGTKIRYYNAAEGGYGTCIYLWYSAGAETLKAGSPVGVGEALANPYLVTGDQSVIADGAPTAIALSPMTTAYYGWFWCGGVCPDLTTTVAATATESLMSAIVVATDDSVVAGKGVQLALGATDHVLVVATTSAVITKVGYAIADDGGAAAMTADNLHLYDNWG